MATQEVTWDQVYAGLARVARERGEWAGLPMPVKGTRMVIHPSYPFAEGLSKIFDPEPDTGIHYCRNSDISDGVTLRNEFLSVRYGCWIRVWRDENKPTKKSFVTYSRKNSGPMLLTTMGAARAWDFQAECTAMETLRSHLTAWAFQCYVMTGMFLETSKKTGIIYLFRRLRPTVAITPRAPEGDDRGVRILACLCLHPIGYYQDTWGGAMVPTDDVISHLLLMRGDEYLFWKQANQHTAWDPASGL